MAAYEYNSTINEIEVTTGQAFEYENQAARWTAVKKSRATYQINDNFRIQEVNGMFKVQYLVNGTWQYHQTVVALNGESQAWWCFSYDEAYALVQAYMTLFGWMSGIAAASTPTLVEEELEAARNLITGFSSVGIAPETFEDMLAAQYNERLLNQVIYYTENADGSERVARLLQASRSGVLLADPADPHDRGCWYSFSEVSNIQRGRQYGWK